jgi:hypothetical protein
LTRKRDSNAEALEELLQFLYLTPVGIVKFAADGAIGLINPMASQLLLPLGPNAALDNLYESLAPLVPDLRGLVDRFTAKAGAVLDEPRLETRVGGARQVLSLTVSRVNDNVYMAVLDDVTKVAEQEQEIFADQQRFRAIFDTRFRGAASSKNGTVRCNAWAVGNRPTCWGSISLCFFRRPIETPRARRPCSRRRERVDRPRRKGGG